MEPRRRRERTAHQHPRGGSRVAAELTATIDTTATASLHHCTERSKPTPTHATTTPATGSRSCITTRPKRCRAPRRPPTRRPSSSTRTSQAASPRSRSGRSTATHPPRPRGSQTASRTSRSPARSLRARAATASNPRSAAPLHITTQAGLGSRSNWAKPIAAFPATELQSPRADRFVSRFVPSAVGPPMLAIAHGVTCSPGAASRKAIVPERAGVAASPLRLSAQRHNEGGQDGTIAPGCGSAGASVKAGARRMPPTSTCVITAQPGRCSSPTRPAGLLPAWQSHSDAGVAARTEAVVARPGRARLDVGERAWRGVQIVGCCFARRRR